MLNFLDFQDNFLTAYQAEHGVSSLPIEGAANEAWAIATENKWHNALQRAGEKQIGQERVSLFRKNNLPTTVAYILIQGPRGYHTKGVYTLVIDDLDNEIKGLRDFEVDQKLREAAVDPLIGW